MINYKKNQANTGILQQTTVYSYSSREFTIFVSYRKKNNMAKIRQTIILLLFSSMLPAGAQTWELVWEDPFDGQTLDSSIWSIEEKKGIWNTGQNAEFQRYRRENVQVGDDGNGNNCLILTAKEEKYKGFSYTSGKVFTKGKFAFRRGKLEAAIRVPDLANGLWPAFWTLGYVPLRWPDKGEIDIMEMGHASAIPMIRSTVLWEPTFSGALITMVTPITGPNSLPVRTCHWAISPIRSYGMRPVSRSISTTLPIPISR